VVSGEEVDKRGVKLGIIFQSWQHPGGIAAVQSVYKSGVGEDGVKLQMLRFSVQSVSTI